MLGDLRDREAFGLAEVARERNRATALTHAVIGGGGCAGRHATQVLLASAVSSCRGGVRSAVDVGLELADGH